MSTKIVSLIISIAYVLTAFSLLTACGTKGPLYIPEQRYPQASSVKPNTTPNLDKSGSDTQRNGQ